jgi:hypothetical protein
MTMLASSFAVQDTGRLFEPDAILPAQFYAMFRQSHQREPERRLMVAILEDAVSCLSINARQCTLQQRKQFEEARHWVSADEESDWIFSFHNICEALGLDASYVRQGLMQRNAVNTMRPASKRVTTKLRGLSQRKKLRLRASS